MLFFFFLKVLSLKSAEEVHPHVQDIFYFFLIRISTIYTHTQYGMHWLFSHLLCYSCCTTAAWFTRWWGRNDTLRKQGRVISSSRTWMTMHEQGQVNFALGCSSPLCREISIYHHSTSFTKLFLDHVTAFPNFWAICITLMLHRLH